MSTPTSRIILQRSLLPLLAATALSFPGSAHAAEFTRAMKGELPADAFARLDAHIAEAASAKPAAATRQHSGSALDALFPSIPEMVGGSADLTGSNNTFVKNTQIFDTPDYSCRYVNYGVR